MIVRYRLKSEAGGGRPFRAGGPNARYIVLCRMDDGNLATLAPWKIARRFTTIGENDWWCVEYLHNMRRCCSV